MSDTLPDLESLIKTATADRLKARALNTFPLIPNIVGLNMTHLKLTCRLTYFSRASRQFQQISHCDAQLLSESVGGARAGCIVDMPHASLIPVA